jgi:hypothetical protein
MGFTVDSLLKLNASKAFDKKTTVLQYVIMLLYRNDEDCLKFPEDLKSVNDASRYTVDALNAEKNNLKDEFNANFKIVLEIQDKDSSLKIGTMIDFLTKAWVLCDDLDKRY